MAEEYKREYPIIRAAPTGVAAHGINSRTIQSLFRLPGGPNVLNLTELASAAIQALQATFKDVHYLVMDEKSMIHIKQWSWIDQRCQVIFPAHKENTFGELSIILAGVFSQLAPVGGCPLYWSGHLVS